MVNPTTPIAPTDKAASDVSSTTTAGAPPTVVPASHIKDDDKNYFDSLFLGDGEPKNGVEGLEEEKSVVKASDPPNEDDIMRNTQNIPEVLAALSSEMDNCQVEVLQQAEELSSAIDAQSGEIVKLLALDGTPEQICALLNLPDNVHLPAFEQFTTFLSAHAYDEAYFDLSLFLFSNTLYPNIYRLHPGMGTDAIKQTLGSLMQTLSTRYKSETTMERGVMNRLNSMDENVKALKNGMDGENALYQKITELEQKLDQQVAVNTSLVARMETLEKTVMENAQTPPTAGHKPDEFMTMGAFLAKAKQMFSLYYQHDLKPVFDALDAKIISKEASSVTVFNYHKKLIDGMQDSLTTVGGELQRIFSGDYAREEFNKLLGEKANFGDANLRFLETDSWRDVSHKLSCYLQQLSEIAQGHQSVLVAVQEIDRRTKNLKYTDDSIEKHNQMVAQTADALGEMARSTMPAVQQSGLQQMSQTQNILSNLPVGPSQMPGGVLPHTSLDTMLAEINQTYAAPQAPPPPQSQIQVQPVASLPPVPQYQVPSQPSYSAQYAPPPMQYQYPPSGTPQPQIGVQQPSALQGRPNPFANYPGQK